MYYSDTTKTVPEIPPKRDCPLSQSVMFLPKFQVCSNWYYAMQGRLSYGDV